MSSKADDASCWRALAAEALEASVQLTRADAKATMLTIALGYEHLAEVAERGPAIRESVEPQRLLRFVSSYGPAELEVIFKAFDDAWDSLAPSIGSDIKAVGAARLKLAQVILGLARPDEKDPDRIKIAALRIMERAPGKRG